MANLSSRIHNSILIIGLLSTMVGAGAASDLPWDIYSDTWTATDDLGRTLPDHTQVGGPRPEKQVGIFYFLWLGRHGERGPFDISKILQQDSAAMQNPESPLWGPIHAPHHWGESVFGYYVSDDDFVLRKHAQMLADAGVDVVIFDVSNQLTYPESWRALGKVFADIRREGQRTPQFAFLCPFWSPAKVVRELYTELYEPRFHPELWYHWEGKPLILADPESLGNALVQPNHDHPARLEAGQTLGQTFRGDEPIISVAVHTPTWETSTGAVTLTLRRGGPQGELLAQRRFLRIHDNAWLTLTLDRALEAGEYYLELSQPDGSVGWWSHTRDQQAGGQAYRNGLAEAGDRVFRVGQQDEVAGAMKSFFTFRKPQPDYFTGPTGPEQWGWLEVYPQHVFYKVPGTAEQMTVGVAQNAVDGKLSVLSNPRARGRSFHEGKQPGPDGHNFHGRNFAEQWERALTVDPPFIFITGWNEWIAGRFKHPSGFYGDGPVTFVDQFNREYSRDIEPMRGGHGDAFYYQMIANIRRFKGTRANPPISSRPIAIDGHFEDWREVSPEFRDTRGDPVDRDYRGWGRDQHYADHSGRRDLVRTKVSVSEDQVCFYLQALARANAPPLPAGLRLYLDLDGNPTNGWLGYDAVVNRTNATATHLFVEKHRGEGYAWSDPVPVPFRADDDSLELAIPLAALPIGSTPKRLDFKWADHIEEDGDWSDLTLHGDVAPNDRYNYRAVFGP